MPLPPLTQPSGEINSPPAPSNDLFLLRMGSAEMEFTAIDLPGTKPPARWRHSASLIDQNQILLFGGFASSSQVGNVPGHLSNIDQFPTHPSPLPPPFHLPASSPPLEAIQRCLGFQYCHHGVVAARPQVLRVRGRQPHAIRVARNAFSEGCPQCHAHWKECLRVWWLRRDGIRTKGPRRSPHARHRDVEVVENCPQRKGSREEVWSPGYRLRQLPLRLWR